MTNAERILRRLDDLLSGPVHLTLYGRAAMLLGFPKPKPEFARSKGWIRLVCRLRHLHL